MATIKLRSLHPEDFEAVVAIDAGNSGRLRRDFFKKRLDLALASPDTLVTCAALDGDKLAGFGFVRIEDGAFGVANRVAIVDIVGVATDCRQQGIGSLIMKELERRLQKQSIGSVRTLTDWSDTAMSGYFASTGFLLSPAIVLQRGCETQPSFEGGDPEMTRHQDGANEDFTPLFRDTLPVRSMQESDLPAIVRIDKKLTGTDRSSFYANKMQEMMNESGIRVSLVAEQDNAVVGFVMVRLDYGDFGQTEPSAVLDTIGVHPSFSDSGVGQALLSQLLVNLAALRVNSIQTQVEWERFGLLKFLESCGFRPTQSLVLEKSLA